MKKNTLVILGHPDADSFCGALAKTYIESAMATDSEIRELQLGKLKFDPTLWKGYKRIQELEPDLVNAQDLIQWSNHIVFVYPNWWGTMASLMKGFFDRAFLPSFAFKYRNNSALWDNLLSGRIAHLIVTMDTPSWYYRWIFQRPGHNEMKRTILGFCDIKVTQITEFSPIKEPTPQQREKWVNIVKAYGSKVR